MGRTSLTLLLILFWASGSAAQTSIRTVQSGPWSAPSTWEGGQLPTPQQIAEVSAGHVVGFETTATVAGVVLHPGATFVVARDVDTRLTIGCNFIAHAGATVDMGTPTSPIVARHDLRFALTQAQVALFVPGPSFNPNNCRLWLMGAHWTVAGTPITRLWGKLGADVTPGDTQITVAGYVGDWPVGARVALSQTKDFVYSTVNGTNRMTVPNPIEHELLTIAAVSGSIVTLTTPAQFAHAGTGLMRGEIALVDQNITIATDLEGYAAPINDVRPRTFASIMIMSAHGDGTTIQHTGCGTVQIEYASIQRMGAYGLTGHYPLHFHRLGDCSRGTVVKGISFLETGFRSTNRHESNGILLEDTVSVFSGGGSAHHVEVDDGTITQVADVANSHNLCIGVTGSHFSDRNNPLIDGDRLRAASCFWPGASEHEASAGDVSAGPATDRAESNGFHWPEAPNSIGKGTIARVMIAPEAHGHMQTGFHAWQNRGARGHDIVGLKTWQNGVGFHHGAYGFEVFVYNGFFARQRVGYRRGVVTGLVQDSTFLGRGPGATPLTGPGASDKGVESGSYAIQPHPMRPNRYYRNTFHELTPSATGEPGVGIWRNASVSNGDCVDASGTGETDWSARGCSSSFVHVAENIFGSGITPYHFGFPFPESAVVRPFWPNTGSHWIDHDRRLVLVRKDMQPPDGAFAPQLVNASSFYDQQSDALATPFSTLPPSLTFTNLLSYRDRPYGPYILDLSYNPPPTVTMTTTVKARQVRMVATVSADTTRLEFWIDWVLVCERTAAPWTCDVSLDDLQAKGDLWPGRKFAYAYARAFDEVELNTYYGEGSPPTLSARGYIQRAYTNPIEITPEMQRVDAPPPPPPPPPGELEQRIAALEAQLVSVTTTLTTTTQQRDAATAELAVRQAQLVQLQALAEQLQASHAALGVQLVSVQADLASVQSTVVEAIAFLSQPTPDVPGALAALGVESGPAAVAHDVSSESHPIDGIASVNQASFSWTHTPAGTPKGVVVYTFTVNHATEHVTGVTYGGVSVPAVPGGSATTTTGDEDGVTTAWFLGAGIPLGAQSVVVTRITDSTNVYAVAVTVTSEADVIATGLVVLPEPGSFTEQAVTDGSLGANSVRYAGIYSGNATPPAVGSHTTLLQSNDLGARGVAVGWETIAGQGSRLVGFENVPNVDDRAGVHLAIRGVD